MKNLIISVDFKVSVPNDTDIEDLCIDVNPNSMRVLAAPSAMPIDEAVISQDYLTTDVIDVTEPTR